MRVPVSDVYPYTLMAQLRHLQNGGGKKFRTWGDVRQQHETYLCIYCHENKPNILTNCFLKRHKSLTFWLLRALPQTPTGVDPTGGLPSPRPSVGGDCATSFGG